MVTNNQNEQTFTYDHSNLRGLENFSPLSSYEKNSQSVSDCARYYSFVYSEEELRVDSLKKENGKRPLADVSPNQVGYKRPKQDSISDSFQGSPRSDEVACSGTIDTSWCNLESPIWVPTFPSYYDCAVTRSSKVKPTCSPFRASSPVQESSPVRNDPFHKPVAIGPNHQADIPCFNNKFEICDNNDDKWVYIVSKPNSGYGLNGKIECDCLDEDSIYCVRKHVSEAREKFRRELGQEKFEKLGFCDMGEEVALKWGEEEQRLFAQVVLSNPQSSDKNFWEELPKFFPLKTNKELVSYYFNVFMLRKRAMQNRFDPNNVDSDDDEWQETQNESPIEYEEDEEEEEEEEGSGIESVSDRDELVCDYDFIRGGTCEKTLVRESEKEEPCFGFGDDQNDSCTSFDESLNCENRSDGFGVILNDGFFGDGLKTWDNSFFTDKGSSKDDFSEMGSAFEEFIGTENWELGEI